MKKEIENPKEKKVLMDKMLRLNERIAERSSHGLKDSIKVLNTMNDRGTILEQHTYIIVFEEIIYRYRLNIEEDIKTLGPLAVVHMEASREGMLAGLEKSGIDKQFDRSRGHIMEKTK